MNDRLLSDITLHDVPPGEPELLFQIHRREHPAARAPTV
jgi:hypothetical protein